MSNDTLFYLSFHEFMHLITNDISFNVKNKQIVTHTHTVKYTETERYSFYTA